MAPDSLAPRGRRGTATRRLAVASGHQRFLRPGAARGSRPATTTCTGGDR